MFALKVRCSLLRFAHLDYDVRYDAYVIVTTFEKQDDSEITLDSRSTGNTVNLSVVCKLTFAFPPDNICVSVK